MDEEGDLLIICYDNFYNAMTDFVNWKKTRGMNTTIVKTSTISSSLTYSNLKTYIQNQYNANNNLTHVLLVGDVAQIPGYSYSGGGCTLVFTWPSDTFSIPLQRVLRSFTIRNAS